MLISLFILFLKVKKVQINLIILKLYNKTTSFSFHTQGGKSSIKKLVVDDQFLNGLQRFNDGDINVTIGDLFPSLTQLTFTTLQTVSPGVVERLAHSSLAVLSIEHHVEGGRIVPFIGEPTLLGQLFSSSFPQLNHLTFQELGIGNIRSEAILRHLKNHLHLKSIRYVYQSHEIIINSNNNDNNNKYNNNNNYNNDNNSIKNNKICIIYT